MDGKIEVELAVLIYKLASLGAGVLVCYMGYRLFSAGIFGDAGSVDATFKDTRLLIRRGAPGTFFAVVGAVVLALTLFKGINLDTRYVAGDGAGAQIAGSSGNGH